jgi:uncharacterized repeat protein (TIGR03803 family)
MILPITPKRRFSFLGIVAATALGIQTADTARVRATESFEVLYRFAVGLDGSGVPSGLVQARDGSFYGTTERGGAFDRGTIFRISPDGALTILHAFTPSEGTSSSLALVAGRDGNYYGTGRGGDPTADTTPGSLGAFGIRGTRFGTVFQVTTDGAFSVLHMFTGGSDGANPSGALIQADDETFYGTTDGQLGKGTVFKMTRAGEVSILRTFTSVTELTPNSLMQATDGHLYGTTLSGGVLDNAGSIFKMSTSGAYTILHRFTLPEGVGPVGLIQASDGNLYGPTHAGGAYTFGTIFKISTTGRFATLHMFTGADGILPSAGLVEADGNFYGTTTAGGAAGLGTVFMMTSAGSLRTIHAFTASEGTHSSARLIASGGYLYGTRDGDGRTGNGLVFRLSIKQR